MSEVDREIARRGYLAFNRGGVEAILEFLDPEIEWRASAQFSHAHAVFRGHAGVREVLSVHEENLDDLQADPHEVLDLDGYLVVPFSLRGKAKGSGEEISIELVHVWTTADGTATRVEVFATKDEALAAIRLSSD